MEDERYFGFLVSDVARLLRTEFDRRVRDFGLTRSQWLALTRIYRQPGCTQSELAETMEMEKGSAGRLIDRLEDNGFVVRESDPADRRVKRIHLTPEAEAIERTMRRIARQTILEALSDLDETERDKAVELLITVKARLQEMLQNKNQAASAVDRQMVTQ
ncbi:MAG: MarR family transcriptional regulator [Alphaproteobacteria bacterium]|nr:MarR family transcriptional regulator [Alphaproteobacteria bacterium]MCY4318774.1 MarR family transcriptional regulator [Alphaproteobacteria bacterium]